MTSDAPASVSPAVSAALADAQVAALLQAGAPVVLAGGAPSRVLWANAAAYAAFGGPDCEALTRRLFEGQEPAARRLSTIVHTLRPGGSGQLQRLRWRRGAGVDVVTMLCRRFAGPDLLLLVAAPGMQVDARAGADAAPVEAPAPEIDPPAAEGHAPPQVVATPAHGPDDATPPGPPTVDAEAPRVVRFLWRTDSQLRFSSITGALCETVGCRTADLLGQDFREVAVSLRLDPRGTLRAALARRETWSRVDVLWPFADGLRRAPVSLGGLPCYDRDGAFDGLTGFGVIHLDEIVEGPAPAFVDEAPPARDLAVDIPADAPADMPADAPANTPADIAADAPPVADERAPAPAIDDDADPLDREPSAPPAPIAANVVPLRPWTRETAQDKPTQDKPTQDKPAQDRAAQEPAQDKPTHATAPAHGDASADAVAEQALTDRARPAPQPAEQSTSEPAQPAKPHVGAPLIGALPGERQILLAPPKAPAHEAPAGTETPAAPHETALPPTSDATTPAAPKEEPPLSPEPSASTHSDKTSHSESPPPDGRHDAPRIANENATDSARPDAPATPAASFVAPIMERPARGDEASAGDGESPQAPLAPTPAAADQPVKRDAPQSEAPAPVANENEQPAAKEAPAIATAPAAHAPVEPAATPHEPDSPAVELSPSERNAFREIARALGARIEGDGPMLPLPLPPSLARVAEEKTPRGREQAPSAEAAPPPTHIAAPAPASRIETASPAASDENASKPAISPDHAPRPLITHDAAANIHAAKSDAPKVERAESATLENAEAEAPRQQTVPSATLRTDTPKPDAPKPDASKPDARKSDAPDSASAPVVAAPSQEQPAAENVAQDNAAPAQRTPKFLDADPAAAAAASKNLVAVSATQARAIFDRLDAGVLVTRDGEPLFVNRALLDLLGWSDSDSFMAAGGVARMFRGRDPQSLMRDLDGGAAPVVTRDGDVIALEARSQTTPWDGAPATLTFLRKPAPRRDVDDLNARIQAHELDLRRVEGDARELRAILDTATDGVAVLDEDGRILSLNRAGQALFGYEQNEVVGESFTVLLARDSHAAALDYLSGLKSNGVRSVLNDGREVIGRARQGGAIPMSMTIGRVGGEKDARFCAVLRDMTHWKKVERELSDARRDAERASALKSEFLAKISHEIRTPLNAILGFAEVIMEERFGPVGNERYKDYLKDIHASGAHVLSLVNDLLDLSKIEAGKQELNFGAVDANRIVNDCVSIMQSHAIRDRVIMRLSLAPRLPHIVADERSLRQIVLNILSNAVKFNEPGGQVIVSTALTDAGYAVIRVRDTGIGMTDEEVVTALEPFRQIATARETTGTGLGLPLTKALVEANRASFVIKSRKREGTMVEVAFPPTRVLAE